MGGRKKQAGEDSPCAGTGETGDQPREEGRTRRTEITKAQEVLEKVRLLPADTSAYLH